MKYVLYVKQTCPFCIKAQEFLEERGENFKIINFEEHHEDVLQNIKEAYEWPTVPMVFKIENNINFIGGYTDLINHFAEH
jgi:glutaredoxin